MFIGAMTGVAPSSSPSASTARSFPLRVLHLIGGLGPGGAENALARLVLASDPDQITHHVVSIGGGEDQADRLRAAGRSVTVISPQRRPGPLSVLRLARTVSEVGPQIVQGWMARGNLIAWASRGLWAPRAKLAWNLRISTLPGQERLANRVLTRLLKGPSAGVDLLVSNSRAGLIQHLDLGYAPRRADVIPNGFNPEQFYPDPEDRMVLRRAWGVDPETPVIGLIGRFHPQKGHATLFEALSRLAAEGKRFRLILAGHRTGDDAPEALERGLVEAGIAERTLRLGVSTEVGRLYRGLDIACLPSLYEGFPNVLGEAMSSGCACVASAVSDVPEIVGDAGLLTPPGDPAALAEALSVMIERGPSFRAALGAAARRRIIERYSLSACAERYAAAYLALTAPDKT